MLGGRPVRQDHADAQAEEDVHPADPLGVALREVVVDRDDVHAVAAERVEVGGEHAGQGLALTGLHLGDVAEVQGGAAHQLDVVRTLAEHPPGALAGHRERLDEQRVERFAVGVALLELLGPVPQLVITEVGVLVLDRVDRVSDRLEPSHHAAFAERVGIFFQNRHGSTLP
nr:hypothetical protein GCM10020092_096800 [Actinoplanes digitatis]